MPACSFRPAIAFDSVRTVGLAALVALLAACGSGSSDTPVVVGPSDVAPAVTLQPLDASVTAPATATFTAAASGSPAPSTQWQRSNDAGTTWVAIAGATAASYTTSASVAGDNDARFRAVFTNAAGIATSNAGKLTVTSTALAPGLSLLAGDIGGPGTVDGTGAAARFLAPKGMAIDSAGNVYLADWHAHVIRKMTPAGIVTTLAGDASSPYALVDGTGSAARFNSPIGVTVDPAGNVYVGDFGNYAIRKITPAGVVTTFAGGSYGTTNVDGVGTAAKFGGPIGVALDSHGNLFVADQDLHSIRKITPAGVVSTFAGVSSGATGTRVDGSGASARFLAPQALAIDGADNLYVGDGGVLRKVTPAAVVTTVAGASAIADPEGLTVDTAGNVFVADRTNNVVFKVSAAGTTTVFAGTVRPGFIPGYADGTGPAAAFYQPTGIVVDASGNLYVCEEGNALVRKITPAAVVTTFAGAPALTGRDDGIGAAARFTAPNGVAIDSAGNVVVADAGGNSIRKLTPGGVVTTVAGSIDVFGSDDGPTATATFRQPSAVALDAAGNLYVADNGNATVRKITPGGTVSTLAGTAGVTGFADGTAPAASFQQMGALATDAAGNVYVADPGANLVRKITPAGVVTTLAGQGGVSGSADGTGAAATFNSPYGVAVDPSGNVLVADSGNNVVRRITPAGLVTTLAGTAGASGSGDGTGAAARFGFPYAVATDAAGNAFVTDLQGQTVRKVTPAGVVTTQVGAPGHLGVHLGTDASLSSPRGIAWLPTGQLAITSANAVLLYTLP